MVLSLANVRVGFRPLAWAEAMDGVPRNPRCCGDFHRQRPHGPQGEVRNAFDADELHDWLAREDLGNRHDGRFAADHANRVEVGPCTPELPGQSG